MSVPYRSHGESQSISEKEDESLDGSAAGDSNAHGTTRNSSTDTQEQEHDKQERDVIAKQESIMVFRLRLLVFFVLLVAATAVSVIVYCITANSEENEARAQFEGASERVLEVFLGIAESKLAAVTSVAIAEIAHAIDHGFKWPLITLSSFQHRAATARAQSGTLQLTISPMVTDSDRKEWEKYAGGASPVWLNEAMKYQDNIGLLDFVEGNNTTYVPLSEDKNESLDIWIYDYQSGKKVVDPGPGPYFPLWQSSPVVYGGGSTNINLLKTEGSSGAQVAFNTSSVVIGNFVTASAGDIASKDAVTSWYAILLNIGRDTLVPYYGDPVSKVFFPVFDSFDENRSAVAVITATIYWKSYFERVLPDNMKGLTIVLIDSCSGAFTYQIHGSDVRVIGLGDQHEEEFSDMRRSASFDSIAHIDDGTLFGTPLNHDCSVSLEVYPSSEFYDQYHTKTPVIITIAVAFIFVFTVCMFMVYDRLVERRQSLVQRNAEQTSAIVSSLFPANVRERLLQSCANGQLDGAYFDAPNRRLKSFLSNGTEADNLRLQPIADLFPNCTVLFADISGFTAWSSTRDPAQVFILLQTVYQAFDNIAKRRRVFKVETIGDSYVAVTGVPEPQANHAVIMARFAGECKEKMSQLTAELETRLGPDTGDLLLRFGMHSGPVTAGVLRGERARFQLFGDTVNTASRMESTGVKDRIQVSQTTHDILVAAGKSHWLTPRDDMVEVKGKGLLTTYWLTPNAKKCSSNSESANSEPKAFPADGTASVVPQDMAILQKTNWSVRKDRLVDWMVELLQEHIKKIIAMRKPTTDKFTETTICKLGSSPLDEVSDVLILPRYDAESFAKAQAYVKVIIDPVVLAQLREYVSIIASTYHDNKFHNFEHACHVTMATNKFIKRIVSPDLAGADNNVSETDLASALHAYTHGINSDPLTVLAIIISALVHDVDHRGVSNAQLIVEQKEMAGMYRNKSVAEQNSFDIAWDLLMTPQFEELRACLFASHTELARFRQVLVNVVLATDIFDAELNNLRKERWNKAFSESNCSDQLKNNLRAVIVMEHIIQASDVSHTMQHWHIYRKWNQRLFKEMFTAYKAGRMAKDPSSFWYEGELGFFDNYVIPLAKKLKDCNVFGVSSDECLNYALQNRAEWADRGKELLADMVNEVTAIPSSSAFPIGLMNQ